ncbi:MAG: DUF6512 family protein [Bacteroidia bacterium]|nr:DUF6512 family protein [Bacteroidia bacterium]
MASLEIIGAAFIIVFGCLGHFIFEWSGHKNWAGLFFAVNESTWEHIKLSIYPTLIWGVVEAVVRGFQPEVLVATALGLVTMVLLIPGLFYGYTSLIKKNFLIADITCFLVSVIAGMAVFHKAVVCQAGFSPFLVGFCASLLAMITVFYFRFSFHPPYSFLFRDPISGGFGPQGHDCDEDFHHTGRTHHHHE